MTTVRSPQKDKRGQQQVQVQKERSTASEGDAEELSREMRETEWEGEVFETPRESEEMKAHSGSDWSLHKSKGKRGRKTNLERLARLKNAGSSLAMKAWQLEGGKENEQGVERMFEQMMDLMSVMRQETNEKLQGLKKGMEESRVREDERDGKMEELETEMGRVRNLWEEWDERWKKEKNEVMGKLSEIEKGQSEREEEMKEGLE